MSQQWNLGCSDYYRNLLQFIPLWILHKKWHVFSITMNFKCSFILTSVSIAENRKYTNCCVSTCVTYPISKVLTLLFFKKRQYTNCLWHFKEFSFILSYFCYRSSSFFKHLFLFVKKNPYGFSFMLSGTAMLVLLISDSQ